MAMRPLRAPWPSQREVEFFASCANRRWWADGELCLLLPGTLPGKKMQRTIKRTMKRTMKGTMRGRSSIRFERRVKNSV